MELVLHLDEATDRRLSELGERLGLSSEDVVVAAIRALHARHDGEDGVDALLERSRTRYADALDRLAD